MLPPLIDGSARACFGVTEPNVGLQHRPRSSASPAARATATSSTARRSGPRRRSTRTRSCWWRRTTPIEECARSIDGVALLYTDLDPSYVRIGEIEKMARKAVDSNELFIDGLEIPVEDRIGEEGKGFECLLHEPEPGAHPRRGLCARCRRRRRSSVRRPMLRNAWCFGRPIGKNQAIQHRLADCWMRLQAAELLMWKAAALYDAGEPCGVEATAADCLAGRGPTKRRRCGPSARTANTASPRSTASSAACARACCPCSRRWRRSSRCAMSPRRPSDCRSRIDRRNARQPHQGRGRADTNR